MSYVINAHLRRHKTYRSWFEYHDAEHIVRHTIADPRDIEFNPDPSMVRCRRGVRKHRLSTPDPVHWDCFRFGVIQREDHFTFYSIIDHLHRDPTIRRRWGTRSSMMNCRAWCQGAAPPVAATRAATTTSASGSSEYTSALTLESPEVRAWIEFAENNGGSLPDFPLPLGDPSVPWRRPLVVTLMDAGADSRFESACVEAGARFIGGLLACVALARTRVDWRETYYGLTPVDTRSTPIGFHDSGLVHRLGSDHRACRTDVFRGDRPCRADFL